MWSSTRWDCRSRARRLRARSRELRRRGARALACRQYPDAAFALTSIFASERAGDLLVSARPGYDLRTKAEWPSTTPRTEGCIEEHLSSPCTRALRSRRARGRSMCSRTRSSSRAFRSTSIRSRTPRLARDDWKPRSGAEAGLGTLQPLVPLDRARRRDDRAGARGAESVARNQRARLGGLLEDDRARRGLLLGCPLAQASTSWIILRLLGAHARSARSW